jgi:hypothetical protein
MEHDYTDYDTMGWEKRRKKNVISFHKTFYGTSVMLKLWLPPNRGVESRLSMNGSWWVVNTDFGDLAKLHYHATRELHKCKV